MYSYFTFYQGVEPDEYGGIWELLKEGFMTSFALFLVSLITPSPLPPRPSELNVISPFHR